MTVDERLEYLLKAQESRGANLNCLSDSRARAEKAHRIFLARTEKALKSMARIQHRLSKLQGGAQ